MSAKYSTVCGVDCYLHTGYRSHWNHTYRDIIIPIDVVLVDEVLKRLR